MAGQERSSLSGVESASRLTLDPKHPIPLYLQLKTLLLEDVLRGRYSGERRLPTELELCEHHAISRTPVTRALSELAEEGVILRHRRRGTFVNPHWIRRQPDAAEVRVVVPEGPWEWMLRAAAPAGVELSIVTVSRPSLHQVLTHAVAEGRAPDLALVHSVWIPEFATAGFLHALEDLDEAWVRRDHDRDFLEPLLSADRYGDRTFSVCAVADVGGLWYRRRAFEALGLEPPTTWAELRRVAHALAASGVAHPIVMPGGVRGEETTAYCLVAFLASNGAQVLSDGGVSLDSRATRQALAFLRRLVDEGLMSRDVVRYEWNRPIRLVGQGEAAICFAGSYEARTLAELTGVPLRDLGEHYGFIAVPGGPRGAPASVAGGMVYAIFRQAGQPKLAMRVLESVVAHEVLARVARETDRVPPRRSTATLAALESPLVSLVVDLLEHAVVRPATPAYARVSSQLQVMVESVLTGRLAPAAAAQRTAEMIGAITGLPVLGEARRSRGERLGTLAGAAAEG